MKVDEVDDFGDPTGKSHVTFNQDRSGTFKSSSSSGSLKWSIVIYVDDGWCRFVLKENGKDMNVTTSSISSSVIDVKTFCTVLFKLEDGNVVSFNGEIGTSESYRMNSFVLRETGSSNKFDCREFFLDGSLEVVIKSIYGSYSL